MKDMHGKVKVIHAISPQAVGTTGAAGGVTSGVIDRRGYDSIEFFYTSGTSATVADTVTPVIFECDTTGGTFTSVASADLLPDTGEAALTLTTGVSGNIGYRGNERYLKIRLYGTGTATALVAAVAVAGDMDRSPQ